MKKKTFYTQPACDIVELDVQRDFANLIAASGGKPDGYDEEDILDGFWQ